MNVLYSVQASPYKPFDVCPPTDREWAVPRREERSDLAPSQSSDSERCPEQGEGAYIVTAFYGQAYDAKRKRQALRH